MTGRLIGSYLLITLFTLLVLEIPLAVSVGSLQKERLAADLQRDALMLATIYEDALDNDAPYSPEPASRYAERSGGRVVVVDADGRSIVDTDGTVDRDFGGAPEIREALAGVADRVDTRFRQESGQELLHVAVPVASGGVVHGAVRITFDPAETDAAIRRYRWGLAGIGAVVLVAVAVVGWIIARSVTRPLTDIRRAAVAAGAGDLTVRIDPGQAPVEVRDLALAFNTTADRLQHLIEQQRRFVADASHELRTPLTALRLQLENLADDLSGEGRAELAAALSETDRLTRLVEDLLTIARAESAARRLGPVDVVAAVLDRVELWRAVAEEQSTTITALTPRPPLEIEAFPGAVEQIVDNLISNALAVTPSDGEVEVVVERRDRWVEIHVVDEGPGMSEQERARAFDRFWRGRTSVPGTGLGLSIVKDLAEAAGGRAQLHPSDGGGTDAFVTLPLAGHASAPP